MGAIGFTRKAFGYGELVAFEFAGGATGDLLFDVEFCSAGPLIGGCGDAERARTMRSPLARRGWGVVRSPRCHMMWRLRPATEMGANS